PATFFITAIREAGYDILWNDFLGIIGKYGPNELLFKGMRFTKGRFNRYVSENEMSLTEMLRSEGFDAKAEMMKLLYPLFPFRERHVDADYWLQLTEDQVRELSQSPFVNIGSHGYFHNDLSKLPVKGAMSEMLRSKQFLENIVNKPISSFAFPYGTYTRETVTEAKKANYKQLLAMDFRFKKDHEDTAMRERFTVNPFISPANQMHATITRSYER